jgi:hypothetical protein
MSRENLKTDQSILAMALVGYQIEKSKIEERIRQIRAQIGGKTGKAQLAEEPSENGVQPKRRKFSAAARRRMAAAQKKRWAESRKKQAAG